jgi:hypothetical protein
MLLFNLITEIVMVAASFFAGYSYMRYRHHLHMAAGFTDLATIKAINGRDATEEEIVQAFGGRELRKEPRWATN